MRRYPNGKICSQIRKNLHKIHKNLQYNAYVMHTFAEFCILMWNSASKSINLCGIPHYNSNAEVSMWKSLHYKCLQRNMQRVRIIHLREIEKWFRTHLVVRVCFFTLPHYKTGQLWRHNACIYDLGTQALQKRPLCGSYHYYKM